MIKSFLKKICFALVLFLLCVSFCGCEEKQTTTVLNPTEKFFVNDFADIIDSSSEEQIQFLGERLYSDTTAQAVLVTVKNLDGKDINSFAIELAREWGIGSADKNNGVLLILALEEREVRIEVGSGLEGALTDVKTGRILDLYGMEHFRKDEFSQGLFSVYNSIVNEIYIEYGLAPSEDYVSVDQRENNRTQDEEFDIARIILIVAVLIIALYLGKKNGGRGGHSGGIPFFFFGGPGVYRGGRGGGGFSGGGFGGFSGGGGGFSGGGSGRKF